MPEEIGAKARTSQPLRAIASNSDCTNHLLTGDLGSSALALQRLAERLGIGENGVAGELKRLD
jgi:hypothetical protein